MFRKKNVEQPVNIESEAVKVYQYLKKQYQPIERKRRQIRRSRSFSHCEKMMDELIGIVDGCYAIADHYLYEIAAKDGGLKVLEVVKQKAKQEMNKIDHDYGQPAKSKDVHEFIFRRAACAYHDRVHFQMLRDSIGSP